MRLRTLLAVLFMAHPAMAWGQAPVSAPQATAATQTVDQAYADLIHEFTTEEFFLTPLVDHLPASETVPTPLDVLGYISGTRDRLTHTAQIYHYLREVAGASPRVMVRTIGTSEEGLGSYSLLFNALLHHGNLDVGEEEDETDEDR